MKRIKPTKLEPKPKPPQKGKSSYQKYKCQYKQKSILTKLSSDSGYPQEVLVPARRHSLPASNNFVEDNRQNLKNFFKDRVPPEDNLLRAMMKQETEMINPKRIFQIKKEQFQLKSKTKISLKDSFDMHLGSSETTTFDKLESNFHINDKNRELKEKYGGLKDSFLHYESDNYRRGTQSHIEKRSKIIKKEAYDKVFGPDISSMSRTNGFERKSVTFDTPPRPKSISLTSPFQENNTHKNLRNLIHKMHDYKNKLSETNDVLKMAESSGHNSHGEDHMVGLIKNMGKLYQERTINQGQKIETLEDISKINKSFYLDLLQHKNHRLSKRREMVFQTIPMQSCSPSGRSSPIEEFHTDRFIPDDTSTISERLSSGEDLRDENDESTKLQRSKFLSVVKYHFQLLRKTLVKWSALYHIYGIKRLDIFIAFRVNKHPFDLEGSYAFFKCIKLGEMASVQTFIDNNRYFAFEVDSNGKTPLAYASCHNQTEIALAILSIGVNADLKCFRGHTSLYYALKVRNVVLVRAFLQKGSCPWSTKKNPYGEMLSSGENQEELRTLFKNARKVYIGMQLHPTINKQKQFWDRASSKIVEDQLLDYGSIN